LWQLHNLKPHLSRTFKLSRDPKFLEKLTDWWAFTQSAAKGGGPVRGREKPDSSLGPHPTGLPLKKGRCGTMTHDYKRNGTTTLFAALSVLDGKVLGQCVPRHGTRNS